MERLRLFYPILSLWLFLSSTLFSAYDSNSFIPHRHTLPFPKSVDLSFSYPIMMFRAVQSLGRPFARRTIPSMTSVSQYRLKSSSSSGSIMEADRGAIGTKLYHNTSLFLLVGFPLALLPVPTISFPFELAIGFIIPLHSHIGFNYIITDYVPKAMRSAARAGVLATTVISVLGLTYINVKGDGIGNAFRSLWKKPPAKTSEKTD